MKAPARIMVAIIGRFYASFSNALGRFATDEVNDYQWHRLTKRSALASRFESYKVSRRAARYITRVTTFRTVDPLHIHTGVRSYFSASTLFPALRSSVTAGRCECVPQISILNFFRFYGASRSFRSNETFLVKRTREQEVAGMYRERKAVTPIRFSIPANSGPQVSARSLETRNSVIGV